MTSQFYPKPAYPFHNIRAPKTKSTQPKIRVSVWLLSERIRSLPNQAATAEARPTVRTIFQSMSPAIRELLAVAARAVTMITAIEVATACLCSTPRASTNAGTMTSPPPTPQSAPSRPATRPMRMAVARNFTGADLKE